jgi:diketogulonate reductase-like aldo/keto reductase
LDACGRQQRHHNTSGDRSCLADKIAKGELKREDIFITTKHWRKYHGYEPTLQCLKMSLRALKVTHIDLWLMHWPGPGYWTMSRSKDLLDQHGPWYFALGAPHRPDPVPGQTQEVWVLQRQSNSTLVRISAEVSFPFG